MRARLRPFVTALPRFTPVNVNTASPEVLAAVVARAGARRRARALTAQRSRAYFRNLTEFLVQLPAGAVVDGNDITTASQYFMASVRVTHRRRAGARQRAAGTRVGRGWPAVVWRKYP